MTRYSSSCLFPKWTGWRRPWEEWNKLLKCFDTIESGVKRPLICTLEYYYSINLTAWEIGRSQRFPSISLYTQLCHLLLNYYLPRAILKCYSYYLSRPLSSLSLFQSRAWTLSLGFSLAYGAMFSKTWRVHLIFTNKKLKRKVELKNHKELIKVLSRSAVLTNRSWLWRTG